MQALRGFGSSKAAVLSIVAEVEDVLTDFQRQ